MHARAQTWGCGAHEGVERPGAAQEQRLRAQTRICRRDDPTQQHSPAAPQTCSVHPARISLCRCRLKVSGRASQNQKASTPCKSLKFCEISRHATFLGFWCRKSQEQKLVVLRGFLRVPAKSVLFQIPTPLTRSFLTGCSVPLSFRARLLTAAKECYSQICS